MPRFLVTLERSVREVVNVDVDADEATEARAKALAADEAGDLDWQVIDSGSAFAIEVAEIENPDEIISEGE